jgi:phosphoglucosamine mutase
VTRKLFGTDGIRGTANMEPMSAETALKVAMAAAAELTADGNRYGRVVIGKDTRRSGYMLETAMTAGFISMGMEVTLVGPVPTPAVAVLTRTYRCDLGVMISASHNPFEDNGIKIFGADGYKLSDEIERGIEQRIFSGEPARLVKPRDLGRAMRLEDASGRYIEWVKATFPRSLRLDGLKIVVDCAHGAAYKVAPAVLRELGAEVIAIGVAPDGFNINKECGATHTAQLERRVVDEGADIGIALDGDADRLIVVDETGRRVDGDQIMGLTALALQRDGRLRGGGVVATVMSNLGLERMLEAAGLKLLRAAVGDRYVLEMLRRDGYNFGGEQSGHLIFSDYSTTGDGLLAALQVLAELVRSGKPASELCHVFEPVPQLLRNVRFSQGAPLEETRVKTVIADAEARLNGSGRLLIRKSGTEPLIRVMAEGDDKALVEAVVADIVAAVEEAAGG